jgi:hypothetical protein
MAHDTLETITELILTMILNFAVHAALFRYDI